MENIQLHFFENYPKLILGRNINYLCKIVFFVIKFGLVVFDHNLWHLVSFNGAMRPQEMWSCVVRKLLFDLLIFGAKFVYHCFGLLVFRIFPFASGFIGLSFQTTHDMCFGHISCRLPTNCLHLTSTSVYNGICCDFN